MTMKQAKSLGWTFDEKGDGITVEKGRAIIMAPTKKLALKLIEKAESA